MARRRRDRARMTVRTRMDPVCNHAWVGAAAGIDAVYAARAASASGARAALRTVGRAVGRT